METFREAKCVAVRVVMEAMVGEAGQELVLGVGEFFQEDGGTTSVAT